MQNFIVLGYIPGTQIQINFYLWLTMFVSLLVLGTLFKRRHIIRVWVVGLYLAYLVRQRQLI